MKRIASLAAFCLGCLVFSVDLTAAEGEDARGGGSGFSLIDGGGLEWFINEDVTFTTAESASGAASDATYTAAVAATTSGGGTTMTTLSDAFDGYAGLCITTSPGLGECDPNDAAFMVYSDNGPASVTPLGTTGGEAVFSTQSFMGGDLSVYREVLVRDDQEFARWMNYFTNNSASPVTIYVLTANNLGSDSNTQIDSSSSGDATVGIDDYWVTSFQAFDGSGLSYDPRLCHLIHGPNGSSPVASISFSDGQNQPYWEYEVTIPAGETRAVMQVASGHPSRAAARASCQNLLSMPNELIGDLSSAEQAQVVNFELQGQPQPPTPTGLPVPTLEFWALFILATLVAGAAFLSGRRRAA